MKIRKSSLIAKFMENKVSGSILGSSISSRTLKQSQRRAVIALGLGPRPGMRKTEGKRSGPEKRVKTSLPKINGARNGRNLSSGLLRSAKSGQ